MRVLLLAFVAGCWLLQQQGALPGARVVLAGTGVAGALTCVAWRVRGRWASPVRWMVGVVVAIAAGFGWAACRADMRLDGWLDSALAGRDLAIRGIVAGLPHVADHGTRFMFDVDAWHGDLPVDGAAAPRGRVLLTWQDPPDDLRPGQRYQLTVRLRRPRGLANPHGFDYAYWLLGEGIAATGYVRAGTSMPGDADRVPIPWPVRVAMWRASVRDHIRAALPADARYGAVLVALVMGDQRGIAHADWEVFRRTGIAHLVSISGLHITMLSGAAGALARALWRRSFGMGRWTHGRGRKHEPLCRPLPLIWPAQKAALVVAVLAALAYGVIAGMEVPALRTVTMLVVAAIALWSGRTPPASVVLAWAAGVAVAIDPWAVMSPGFWLSFGAVAVIFFHASHGKPTEDGPGPRVDTRETRWLARARLGIVGAAHTQWAVTIGLVPLTLLLFGQVSVVCRGWPTRWRYRLSACWSRRWHWPVPHHRRRWRRCCWPSPIPRWCGW